MMFKMKLTALTLLSDHKNDQLQILYTTFIMDVFYDQLDG